MSRSAMLRAALQMHGMRLIWLGWLLMAALGLAVSLTAKPAIAQVAGVFIATPVTGMLALLYSIRLWQLDRLARSALLPGRAPALLHAVLGLGVLLVLLPAAVLTAAGAAPLVAVGVLGVAVASGAALPLLSPPALVLLVLLLVVYWIGPNALHALAEWPGASALLLPLPVLGYVLVSGWRRSMARASDDATGWARPLVLRPELTGMLGDRAAPAASLPAAGASRIGAAGPAQADSALGVLLGGEHLPTYWRVHLWRQLQFLLCVVAMALFIRDGVAPMLIAGATMLPLMFSARLLLGVRRLRRDGDATLAEIHLLPRLQRGSGSAQLARRLLRTQLIHAPSVIVMMLAASAWSPYSAAHLLVLLGFPLTGLLLVVLVLPAVLADRRWLDALLVVLAGLLALAVVPALLAFNAGSDVGAAPMPWLLGFAVTVGVAALLGALGALAQAGRPSVFTVH